MMVYLVCRLFDSQYRFNHSFTVGSETLAMFGYFGLGEV